MPAKSWTKLVYDISAIADRNRTVVLRFYPALMVTAKYAFNMDDLAVE